MIVYEWNGRPPSASPDLISQPNFNPPASTAALFRSLGCFTHVLVTRLPSEFVKSKRELRINEYGYAYFDASAL